ncbi:MAG: YIP1 family protein [Acidobacteriia bacterium]|nr:YIP1 family protein [Terriglobia bacterium]
MGTPTVETGVGSAERAHSFWWRWLNVYISPGAAFQDIARKPEFIFPLIVGVVGGLAVIETMLGKIGAAQIIRTSIEQSGRASNMTAEQMQQAISRGSPFVTVTTHLVAVLGPVIFVLIVAALGLAIVNGILGGKLGFKTSLSVAAYSILPGAISSLMTVAVILFGDVERFNPNNPSPTNLGFFLNPLETSKPLMAVASSVDLFSVWTLVLLGIGYSEVTGRKVKALSVSMIYLGALLVWVLGKVGLAAIT